MAIIITRNLSKKFKDLLAVNNVSLEVEEGECFGLLGPNGAGKTSLIRMITAVSPPLGGDIEVAGMDLRKYPRQVKAILGIVPQIDNLDEDLTVLQNLTTFARKRLPMLVAVSCCDCSVSRRRAAVVSRSCPVE